MKSETRRMKSEKARLAKLESKIDELFSKYDIKLPQGKTPCALGPAPVAPFTHHSLPELE